MKKFFEPDTVALIGASDKITRPVPSILEYQRGLRRSIFSGNPKLARIETRRATLLSRRAVPIDLAVIFIPARSVPAVLEQCAQKGFEGLSSNLADC